MTPKRLNKLVDNHCKVNKIRPRSVSGFARANGLHPSTLNKYLAGERTLSKTTHALLDQLYLTAVF